MRILVEALLSGAATEDTKIVKQERLEQYSTEYLLRIGRRHISGMAQQLQIYQGLPAGNTLATPDCMLAVTRVMSPNPRSHEGVLDHVQAICQVCQHLAHDPSVCAGCGSYGHHECLGMEMFFDYAFCAQCIPKALAEYASFKDAQRRESWRRSLQTQIATWKSRAVEAIGMSSSIGVAVGGAVVAAASVAAGLAHGAVRGAAAASSGATPLELPSTDHSAVGSGGRPTAPGALQGAAAPVLGKKVPTTRSRSADIRTQCNLCWNPGLARFRPLVHTYTGNCRLAPQDVVENPAVASAAAAAADVRGPPSAFGSATSNMGEQLMPPKMEHPWPNGNPSGGSLSAGPQAGRGLSGGTPLDKPPGLQPTAQEGQQALQLLADQGTSNRWDAMEHRMLGMEREMRSIRADLQNVLQAANMASEDAQKAALRMDNLEYEWLLWNDGHDYDASDQEQQCAEEGGLPPPPRQSPQEFELIPAATPRAAEGGVNTDLLGLELDPARQWWDAAPTQLVQDRSSMLQLTDLQTGPSPGEGTLQLIAGGRAVVATTAPPGIERTMALAIGNRAGERPEGPSQVSRQSYGEGIWGEMLTPFMLKPRIWRCQVSRLFRL